MAAAEAEAGAVGCCSPPRHPWNKCNLQPIRFVSYFSRFVISITVIIIILLCVVDVFSFFFCVVVVISFFFLCVFSDVVVIVVRPPGCRQAWEVRLRYFLYFYF